MYFQKQLAAATLMLILISNVLIIVTHGVCQMNTVKCGQDQRSLQQLQDQANKIAKMALALQKDLQDCNIPQNDDSVIFVDIDNSQSSSSALPTAVNQPTLRPVAASNTEDEDNDNQVNIDSNQDGENNDIAAANNNNADSENSDSTLNKQDDTNVDAKPNKVTSNGGLFDEPESIKIKALNKEDKLNKAIEELSDKTKDEQIQSWVLMVHLDDTEETDAKLEVALLQHQYKNKKNSKMWITASDFQKKSQSDELKPENFNILAQNALKTKAQLNDVNVDDLHLIFAGKSLLDNEESINDDIVAAYVIYINDKSIVKPPTDPNILRQLIEPKEWQWKVFKNQQNDNVNVDDITQQPTAKALLKKLQESIEIVGKKNNNKQEFRRLFD